MISPEKDPRVILAPTPSPLTGPGTNTFLLGRREVAVIDPGPDLPDHREAILKAVGDGRISHIFVTHAHLDHSPGARILSDLTGAPVLAFGDADAGRSPAMQALLDQGEIGGGEGIDREFRPDILLGDAAEVATAEWRLTAIHTPGHFGNHLSFAFGDSIFCGDLVLGWSSTLISPPDGDLGDYMRSLARLASLEARKLYPAHGAPVANPRQRLAELALHRRARTAQILAALRDKPGTAFELANRIYDVGPELIQAAARNTLAHLVALADLGAVQNDGKLAEDSVFYTSSAGM